MYIFDLILHQAKLDNAKIEHNLTWSQNMIPLWYRKTVSSSIVLVLLNGSLWLRPLGLLSK